MCKIKHEHKHHFENPLTINVNVNVTQKQDERVAELEKQQKNWLDKLKIALGKLKTISDKK